MLRRTYERRLEDNSRQYLSRTKLNRKGLINAGSGKQFSQLSPQMPIWSKAPRETMIRELLAARQQLLISDDEDAARRAHDLEQLVTPLRTEFDLTYDFGILIWPSSAV